VRLQDIVTFTTRSFRKLAEKLDQITDRLLLCWSKLDLSKLTTVVAPKVGESHSCHASDISQTKADVIGQGSTSWLSEALQRAAAY